MRRRRFLAGLGLLGISTALGPWRARAASPCAAIEHAGSLDEVLFVYDQASAPHLLREIVAIVRHLPPATTVHVLVSRDRAEEAAERLREHGLAGCRLLASGEDAVTGDWGRDILQLGCGGGERVLVAVPWHKTATGREDLERGFRQLSPLEGDGFAVRRLPVAAEGGNLAVDEIAGRRVLLAGTTIAVETRAMYRAYYGTDPGPDGVAEILREGLGVDEVAWLGPREDGVPARQADLLFHIDMGCVVVRPGQAVVARCDPAALSPDRHLELLREEARRTATALARRGVTAADWPAGLDLPADRSRWDGFLAGRRDEEAARLREAARDMELIAGTLSGLGYEVHRLDASPERVRRFQSHTNVIVGRDRLVMPLYPRHERVHGWLVRGERGRDSVDIELGAADSEYALDGDNLAAYELYRRLHPDVRTVRDYFYLAGGNVHCVIGRLS